MRWRLIIVAIRKNSERSTDYEFPAATYTAANPHTARDTAVPDDEVPADHWLRTPLNTLYAWAAPKPGELHKIGRIAPGMGKFRNPQLAITFDCTNNGPTTYGGGGAKPPYSSKWGDLLLKRRLTTVVEFHRIYSLSVTVMAFHDSFNTGTTPQERVHFLRDCVNQGWPAASAFRLVLSIATHLQQAARVLPSTVITLSRAQLAAHTVSEHEAATAAELMTARPQLKQCGPSSGAAVHFVSQMVSSVHTYEAFAERADPSRTIVWPDSMDPTRRKPLLYMVTWRYR